jgi:hypothetical protein
MKRVAAGCLAFSHLCGRRLGQRHTWHNCLGIIENGLWMMPIQNFERVSCLTGRRWLSGRGRNNALFKGDEFLLCILDAEVGYKCVVLVHLLRFYYHRVGNPCP